MWESFFDFSVVQPEPLIDLADAIAAALNSTTFSQPFTAVRRYADLDAKLETLDLAVEVVPVERLDTQLEVRGAIRYLPACDIVIRKRVGGDATGVDRTQVDPLITLLLEINDWLAIRELEHQFTWQTTPIVTPVVHKHLREWHQYTGIIRVTYDTDHDLAPVPKNDA